MTGTVRTSLSEMSIGATLGLLLIAAAAWAQPTTGAADGPAQGGANLPASTVVMQRVVIKDTETGLDAFSMMAPVGWKTNGAVTWHMDRAAAPMTFLAHAADADNTEGFTELPSQAFVWSQMDERFKAQLGGKAMGFQIAPPANGPIDAIKQVILPQMVKAVGRVSVISSEDLPKVAEAYAPTYAQPGQPVGQTLAGKVRIEYTQKGVTKQAEIICVFIKSEGPGGVVWGMDHLSVVYAPTGSLDQELSKLNYIVASLQENPHFDAAVTEVSRELVQEAQQHLSAIMEQSQIRFQAQQQISAQQQADWQANQNARFDAIENYDTGAIKGLVNMQDPHDGSIVQVPDDALHAWSNGNEVIWTKDPNFTPSQYDNTDWREVQPTKASGY